MRTRDSRGYDTGWPTCAVDCGRRARSAAAAAAGCGSDATADAVARKAWLRSLWLKSADAGRGGAYRISDGKMPMAGGEDAGGGEEQQRRGAAGREA
jgi:hypothetical protein